LKEHADGLHKLAKALLERETMTGEELHLLLTGQKLPPIPVDEVVKKTPEPTNVDDDPSTKEESAGGDAAETSEATGEQSSIASDVPPAAAKNSDPEPPVKPSKADPEDFFGTQH
jgi:cell division protease FtsH